MANSSLGLQQRLLLEVFHLVDLCRLRLLLSERGLLTVSEQRRELSKQPEPALSLYQRLLFDGLKYDHPRITQESSLPTVCVGEATLHTR